MAMDQKQLVKEIEEERKWTPAKIFVSIILLPLMPFLFIYRLKINRKLKFILMILYFILLTSIYQIACIKQGPLLKSINLYEKEASITLKEKYQIKYNTSPSSKKLKIASINFKSSDRSKATVDKNGYVTPLQKGNCKITISITDNHHTTKEKEVIIHIVE